ncbi:hypothetical protein NliqN6_2633 [Naganishia liquefaciens]|uniref:BZIP domain-containing protein n=1 Tax=Naganishia liquefaciens TaxID=104408 RepID=A0A8H3YFZ2_9TREE|nr:hypothetical protein NliqN6_2633 [Naganishia liquefaciens]
MSHSREHSTSKEASPAAAAAAAAALDVKQEKDELAAEKDETKARAQDADADADADASTAVPPPPTITTTNAPPASATAAGTATTNAAPPPTLPAVLHRPPIRPAVPGLSKSKFELEPNPFEQSFSRSSTSVHRAGAGRKHSGSSDEGKGGDDGAAEGRDDKARATSVNGNGSRKGSDDRGGEDHKGMLPPLSALTSPQPVDPASHFSWSGLSSSLRAGPLSPAMLAGPATTQQQHGTSSSSSHLPSVAHASSHGGFDPSTFRTGFTPGGGSGFTPGYAGLLTAGGGFPMPSPNTAAFLSMVTNGTPGAALGSAGVTTATTTTTAAAVNQDRTDGKAGDQGSVGTGAGGAGQGGPGAAIPAHLTGPTPSATVDITPNTLNALTGVINQMNSNETAAGGSAAGANGATMFPPPPPPVNVGGPPPQLANGATGHQLPPPPPHPEHPMAQASDYFVQSSAHPHHHSHHSQHPPSHGGYPNPPMSLPPAHLHASVDPRTHVNGYGMHPGQGLMSGAAAAAAANPQAAAAANGLFLLSQAHQELSKREEEHRDGGGAGTGATGRGGRNKRKLDDTGKPLAGGAGAGAAGGRQGGKRAKRGAPDPMPPSQPPRNGFVPAYPGQSILQQSQALLAQGVQAQAERDAMMEDGEDDEDQKMLDLAGHGKDGEGGADGKKEGKPETEEEKRKNFLERNRQAALKCRQRKKAWLTQLQTKVDGLTEENERLKAMLTSITDEAQKLSAVLASHRDCPGMAASMAQLGLTLPQMPMPPPPPPEMGGMPFVPPQPQPRHLSG